MTEVSGRNAYMAMQKDAYTALPMWTLTSRELVRFYRQRSRVIGALGTPILFWLFLGSGLGAAFPAPSTPGGKGFIEYFFPSNLVLVLLFTAIFSTISIIEDRREGFLQSVLVAPVTKLGLVGGKVWGGAILAIIQGLLFLAFAPAAGIHLGLAGTGAALLSMLVMSLTLTALGFLFAWKFNSVQGYHSIMNLVLFPMWLLCGSFFPVSKAPVWLQPVMYANPLTYGLASLKDALYWGADVQTPGVPGYWTSILVTLAFGAVFCFISIVLVSRRSPEEL